MKERIIGAIVLVALVVLVVPVFLDGPPDTNTIISESVPLPGQSDQKSQTVVLERTRDEPMPSQSVTDAAGDTATAAAPKTDPPAQPEPQPEPQQPVPVVARTAAAEPSKSEPAEPEPAASAPARTRAVSATGMFAVQLGSFSNQQNAERLAADLRQQGFAAFLSQLSTPDGQLHRVRVGPQKDREAAEAMAARLAKAGHKGSVLPHP